MVSAGGSPAVPRRRALRAMAAAHVLGLVLTTAATACLPPPPPRAVSWRTDLASARAEARSDGRPLMVDFTARWCASCQALDVALADVAVQRALARFVAVRVDVTDLAPATRAHMAAYGVASLPHIAFESAQGEILSAPRVRAALTPGRLARVLRSVP